MGDNMQCDNHPTAEEQTLREESKTARWIRFTVKALSYGALFLCLGYFAVQAAEMGSGAVPIANWIFHAVTGTVAVILGLLAASVRAWKGCFFGFLLAVFMVVAPGFMVVHVTTAGLEKGKEYGKALAHSVLLFKEAHGQWPATLADIPTETLPPLKRDRMWPFIVSTDEDGKYYQWVAGFRLYYITDKTPPRLFFDRRGPWVEWNWEKVDWETPQRQSHQDH